MKGPFDFENDIEAFAVCIETIIQRYGYLHFHDISAFSQPLAKFIKNLADTWDVEHRRIIYENMAKYFQPDEAPSEFLLLDGVMFDGEREWENIQELAELLSIHTKLFDSSTVRYFIHESFQVLMTKGSRKSCISEESGAKLAAFFLPWCGPHLTFEIRCRIFSQTCNAHFAKAILLTYPEIHMINDARFTSEGIYNTVAYDFIVIQHSLISEFWLIPHLQNIIANAISLDDDLVMKAYHFLANRPDYSFMSYAIPPEGRDFQFVMPMRCFVYWVKKFGIWLIPKDEFWHGTRTDRNYLEKQAKQSKREVNRFIQYMKGVKCLGIEIPQDWLDAHRKKETFGKQIVRAALFALDILPSIDRPVSHSICRQPWFPWEPRTWPYLHRKVQAKILSLFCMMKRLAPTLNRDLRLFILEKVSHAK